MKPRTVMGYYHLPMPKSAVILSGALFASQGLSAPSTATIATWMDHKDAAVSIVYDDNSSNQFEIAQPMMDARGIRGTFFVVPKWSGPVWDSIKSASRRGHEIGSHTMTHPNMAALADSDLVAADRELKDSKDSIEKMLPGVKCLTLAWPGNKYSKKAGDLAAKYYVSARQGEGTLEVSSPADFYAVRSVTFGDSAITMNRFLDQAIEKKQWLIELLHRVHPTPYALAHTNDDTLRTHLDYLASKKKSVWIAPYGEVFRYIMERDSSLFALKEGSDSIMIFSLTHKLDTGIYDLPLSLKVILPVGAKALSASQNGDTIPIELESEGERAIVKMAAYPNRGEIALRIQRGPASANSDWKLERIPGHGITQRASLGNTVFFSTQSKGSFSLKVFKPNGKAVGKEFRFEAGPGFVYQLKMELNSIARGRHIVVIYSGSKVVTKRSVLLK